MQDGKIGPCAWERASMYYFKYRAADWVKQHGLPQHHRRIVSWYVDGERQRWYCIFDTTLRRGYADYGWILADELEANSELDKSAENVNHARAILQGCESLRYLPYSILQRQDCESIQRYLQSAREEDRWSPAVWEVIGTALGVGLFVAYNTNQQEEKRKAPPLRKHRET